MMTIRGERLKFVGIIAVLIVATLIQTLVPFIRIRPLDENRNPAALPDIIGKIVHGDGHIAADINAWFDDRMGFRSFLTRLANQIDYSIFSYSKKVLIGKDGWLFDRDTFTAAISLSRIGDHLNNERKKFDSIAEFLKRRNIRLVVVSTPAKETVYRELLPTGTPPGPAISEFEKFRAYLKVGDGRDWIYIDSQDIFGRAKDDKGDLYLRTDLHSTPLGTFLVVKELVNRLAEAERVDWRWNPHLDFVSAEQPNGSNLRYLSVFSYRAEVNSFLRTHYHPESPPQGEVFEKSPAKPFEMIFHNETGRPTIPRTVLFGSSFVDYYVAFGAYSNFKDLYRARGTSAEIGQTLQAIPQGTRYFIFQFWEPHFLLLRYAQIPQD